MSLVATPAEVPSAKPFAVSEGSKSGRKECEVVNSNDVVAVEQRKYNIQAVALGFSRRLKIERRGYALHRKKQAPQLLPDVVSVATNCKHGCSWWYACYG